MGLWKEGRKDLKKYYDLRISKKSDYKSFLFGIPIAAIIILPLLLILIQFYKLYYYDVVVRFFLSMIAWFLLLLANGLSNLFMIKLAKRYYPESPLLMEINELAIFVYNTFDIFFAIFTLILIFYFGVVR